MKKGVSFFLLLLLSNIALAYDIKIENRSSDAVGKPITVVLQQGDRALGHGKYEVPSVSEARTLLGHLNPPHYVHGPSVHVDVEGVGNAHIDDVMNEATIHITADGHLSLTKDGA